MELKNGYKVMYNAPEKATAEKKAPVCASKTTPASSLTDTILVAYINNTSTAANLKNYAKVYSDGTHLFGSVSGVPSDNDINLVIKSGSDIVFGEVITETAAEAVATPVTDEDAETSEDA